MNKSEMMTWAGHSVIGEIKNTHDFDQKAYWEDTIWKIRA
jgi:hypothetical protein